MQLTIHVPDDVLADYCHVLPARMGLLDTVAIPVCWLLRHYRRGASRSALVQSGSQVISQAQLQ
jgi:hypothetical protein